MSKLKQIRMILGLEKFEDATLLDGTKVTADAFVEGANLFVVDDQGNKTPAPQGSHETADLVITVDANGIITSVVAKPKQEVVAEPVPVAAAEEEGGENVSSTPGLDAVKEIVKSVIDEEMKKVYMALEEVAKEVSTVKEEMTGMKGKVSKMAKEPAAAPLKTAFQKETNEMFIDKVSKLAQLRNEFNKK